MNLISVDAVSKKFNGIPLFSGVTFGIDEREHVGFVGPNGSGKSTLLRLLAGKLEPDSGAVTFRRGLSAGMLDQRPAFGAGTSVSGFLYEGTDPVFSLMKEYADSLRGIEKGNRNAGAEFERLGRLMEEKGGFRIEHAYRSLLTELGISCFDAPMESLSGGMVKKAALARLFASGSDILLLDEPTNHLDIVTIEWLEKRLKDFTGAFVLATHDRYFLDAVCTAMLDIDEKQVRKYDGNFSAYLRRRQERAEQQMRQDRHREAVLTAELEWLKRGPKARALKDTHRKARIETLLSERREKETGMDAFSSVSRRLGGKVLKLTDISKSWDGAAVIKPFSWTFSRGERIGIIGPNGSGKSTFLDIISGRILPDGGTADCGVNTVIEYFDQNASAIDLSVTVLDFIRDKAEHISLKNGVNVSAEQFLERFLFPRSAFAQPLSSLSGGELRRLQLVRILASSPNFLLFDEPTNDFDIETISLLEQFLSGFEGCVLTVSHDRAFLDNVADFLFVFDGSGNIDVFPGSYVDYRELPAAGEKPEPSRSPGTKTVSGTGDGTGSAPERKKRLSFREQKEFEGLLDEISGLEDEKKALELSFTAVPPDDGGQTAANVKRYGEVCSLIEEKTARWEELAERV